MALRAGYYGVKRFLRDKMETIAGTYDETIKSLFPRSEQAVLGVKNLLPNNLVNKTDQSVTFTRNTNGTISLSGTAGANVDAVIYDTRDSGELWRGLSLIVSKGVNNDNIKILVNAYNDNTYFKTIADIASGTEVAPFILDYNGYNRVRVTVFVKNGATVNGVTVYPMLRLATDPDDTYVPYAMTNKELTDSAAEQKTAINAIITAATGAADFAAFKTAMGAITPVTRSLSLTKEDITEEVKEDVEPEKTVTKKRTTKKTEEV